MYRVLIVDDEKMIRQGICRAISWAGLGVDKVCTAASAKEALELIGKNMPDLLITDISMSEMSGLDLLEKIREADTDMRVIVLTGYDRFDYAQQALKLSAHDFLLKPVDEEELEKSIREQLAELDRVRRSRKAMTAAGRAEGVRQQYRIDAVLEELFEGKPQDKEQIRKLFAELGVDPAQKMQAGLVLPDMVAQEDEDGRAFRLRSIQNICMGMLDQRGLGITFRGPSDRILLVLFGKRDGSEGEETARELAEILRDEYEIRIRLVIGSVVNGADQLHISYNDAVHSLNSERRSFQEMVIKSRNERRRDTIFQDVFREFKGAIVASVGDIGQVRHIFGRFRVAVESYNLSARYTERCCFELASAVAFAWHSDSGSRSEENLNALMKSLNGTTREKACDVTEVFFERLLAGENGGDHELVRRVKSRIHDGLAEELTVARIAAELYVTPNYLSRLFKRITGEGCNEYIVRKRIEKAKALLEASNLKVGEIAAMVGYTDMNYFSLAFKKHTGVSPTRYRAQVQGGEE